MNMCNNLPLYTYNEMNKDEKEQFEKHLKGCKECRENLKTCSSLKNSLPLQSAPLNVINNIFDKTTRKPHFFSYVKTWKIGLAAAACLMIAVFSVISHNNTNYNKIYAPYDRLSISYEDIYNIDSELDEFENVFLA
ncbi:MAG: zf-HC2 domain-containing protein [Endomicrobia bacterium]|nr:zf-HC2 domain-containing protein [Endomicrobiia bacterium]MCL2799447.1 zf-HC2 domain-containing protein [Endomicrobiia bacterium]